MHPLIHDARFKLQDRCEMLLREHEEKAQRELAEALHALKRIESGAYGFCETCGDLIDEVRLRAQLAARECSSCASTDRNHAKDS